MLNVSPLSSRRRRLSGMSLAITLALSAAAPTILAQGQQGGAAATRALPAGIERVRAVEGITEYRLANGLQVLLAPDDSKPSTTVNMTYRVGSRHENYGETGMAHLLEHLVFKGSKNYPDGWSQFTAKGLRFNGTTSFDRTNYFATFSHNEDTLKWYLGWQADAMVNAFIAKKDLDSEMTVVRNEMEINENNPGGILYQKMLASMYQWHNYGKLPIGARADVEGVDIGRLQAFYRTWYQPDNATLVVSGKFDVARTLAMIREAFGGIPKPTRALPRLYTVDPVQDGERSVTLRRVGGVPLLYSGYHIPPAAHPDMPALMLLDGALSDAPAGRLHKALVETKKAAGVFGSTSGLHDPGFMVFGAQMTPDQDAEAARTVLLQVLENLDKQPITDEEVERERAKWLRSWERGFADPEAIGLALTGSVASGDWRLYFLQRDRIKAVTTADVNRVAKTYLVQANRTLAQYVPTPQPLRSPAPALVDTVAQLKDYKPAETVASTAAFDATPANIDARTQRARVEPGLRMALLPKPTRGDTVNAQLILRVGSLDTLKGQTTAASLMAGLLDKGSTTLSRQQVRDRLTALKTELSIGGSGGAVVVTMTSTRDTLPQAVALVGDLLRNPAFDPAVLEESRTQALAALQQSRDEPGAIVNNTLGRHGNPYPQNDPRYVPTFAEFEQRIRAVTLDQVKQLHKSMLGASDAQFAAVGSFDEAAVRQAVTAAFGQWASQIKPQRVATPLVAVAPQRIVTRTPDKQNAVIGIRLPLAVQELGEDHAALLVANYAFGGSTSSRLWARVREREGLSYGINTNISFNAHEPSSLFAGQAAFAPGNLARVETAMREEFDRVAREGFNAAELKQAIDGLLSLRRLGRAQDGALASGLAGNEWLGRTFASAAKLDEAIARVTPEQATAAWRRHIDPAKLVWSLAGDFKD